MANLTKQAKQDYYNTKLIENKSDYKQIYNIANSLLFRNEPSPLPPINNLAELSEGFNSYFRDKIDKIMVNLKPTDANNQFSIHGIGIQN